MPFVSKIKVKYYYILVYWTVVKKQYHTGNLAAVGYNEFTNINDIYMNIFDVF